MRFPEFRLSARLTVGVLFVAIGMLLLLRATQTGISGLMQERHDRMLLMTSAGDAAAGSPVFSPDAVGLLRIERLGWSVTVRKTAHSRDLARGAGWIPGTALPGTTGNTGIAGHRDTFFRRLADVQVGDEITLLAPKAAELRYRVTDTMIVDPNEMGVLANTRTPTLTLVTCYPFYFVGPAPKRFVVKAEAELVHLRPRH